MRVWQRLKICCGSRRTCDHIRFCDSTGNGLTGACSSKGLDTLAILLSIGSTPVIDATRLTDSFYYTLRSQDSRAFPGRSNNDPNLPALSTALDEQLGLKLEARRGPLAVLVIESVQEPTGN
ncbi:MAG: TIGR03435 family protein [Vicinamibacterales bacterium]